MNANRIEYEKEHIASFIKANPGWRERLLHEPRRLFYDYESNIIYLRFGNPGVVIMTYMDDDDDEFEWGYEEESLQIVAIHIMPFRQYYAPRYPNLQAAYDAMCRDWGEGDWFIDLPPQSQIDKPTAATRFADILLECARDPVPVPYSEIQSR